MTKTLPKSGKFFLAACMSGNHSYVSLGMQQADGRVEMLLDVGKSIPHEKRNQGMMPILYHMLIGDLDANILNENKFIEPKNDGVKYNINYMAYEISYANYQQFLARLKSLNPELKAFVPIAETEDSITFELETLSKLEEVLPSVSPSITSLNDDKAKLSFTKDCRLAARQLAEASLPDATSVDQTMPKAFYKPFACKNKLLNGQFVNPLFILPSPPTAYSGLPKEQKEVLSRLYHRLEKIVQLNQSDVSTRNKFDSIKALYESQVADKELGLDKLLSSIVTWSETNQSLVDTHRGFHFFWQKTATRQFVEKIQEEQGAQQPEYKSLP